MEKSDYIAFVVEGKKREPAIIEKIKKIFFLHANFKLLTLSAEQNIYMLWEKMKEDDFDTDIIEILRENNQELEAQLEGLDRNRFSQVYLFFDYDGHQDNLPMGEETDIIEKMLTDFDNETENGKLYISYPMVEALRDFFPGSCGNGRDCYCYIEEFSLYKEQSAKRAFYNDMKKYTIDIWRELIEVFSMRISCLLGEKGVISYEEYKDRVTPLFIYQKEKK